jgi:signal transduction histidine kinase
MDIFPELLGNQQDLEEILAGKLSNLQLVYVNRETQGKTIYLTMDDLPYQDEEGRILGIVHVVQDETSRGELEQQVTQDRNELRLLKQKIEKQNRDLKTANNELLRLNEFKAQFVHVATYEFRSPLKLLIAHVKMLLEGQVGPLTDYQSEVLKVVQTNGLRLKSMTDELLNTVRLESVQIDLELKPVDLILLVNAVVSENAAKIQAKKQTLDLDYSPELPRALCDEDWTKQIVANLLSNAGKFTPESGRISIRIRLAEQPGFLQLSVADQGVGITEKEQQGKGLYITRSLVELNGGSIRFESQPDLGNLVHVTLPIAS